MQLAAMSTAVTPAVHMLPAAIAAVQYRWLGRCAAVIAGTGKL